MNINERVDMNDKLQQAIDEAFAIDAAISRLNEQLQVLISDMQGAERPHEAGILLGASTNLRDSFYRKLGGRLQEMQV